MLRVEEEELLHQNNFTLYFGQKGDMTMAIRYKIVGKGMTFRLAGSFGLKSLADKKARQIRNLRKKANKPYKSIKVKKYDASR